jgi:hypothetical protein
MNILSDFPSSSLDSHQVSKTLFVSDGTRVNPAGFDLNTFTGIALTFHDNAESTESVPDRGSTFGLLFFSLTALVGLNRLRHVQLA